MGAWGRVCGVKCPRASSSRMCRLPVSPVATPRRCVSHAQPRPPPLASSSCRLTVSPAVAAPLSRLSVLSPMSRHPPQPHQMSHLLFTTMPVVSSPYKGGVWGNRKGAKSKSVGWWHNGNGGRRGSGELVVVGHVFHTKVGWGWWNVGWGQGRAFF